jgi:hypothetical protein
VKGLESDGTNPIVLRLAAVTDRPFDQTIAGGHHDNESFRRRGLMMILLDVVFDFNRCMLTKRMSTSNPNQTDVKMVVAQPRNFKETDPALPFLSSIGFAMDSSISSTEDLDCFHDVYDKSDRVLFTRTRE